MSTERVRIAARGESLFVSSAGVRLHALSYGGGGGRELVLLPGLTCPAVTLEFLAVELAERRRVITMDFRGRGLSDAPASGYSLPDYAGDVMALIRELGLRHPVVVGQALGGRIAPAFDALYPGVAAGLVIIDPPLTGPDTEPYATPIETFLAEIRAAGAADGDAAADVRSRYPHWTDWQIRSRADWLDTCAEHAIVETHANFHREDLLDYFARVTAPATFVYGEHSRALDDGRLQALHRANPEISLEMVPGSGHLIPYDDLPATIRSIERFIDDLEARP